jgi:hypothetical protein
MEVADALSARALEVAFASAMSVVATNGANAGNMHMAAVMRAQLLDYYGGCVCLLLLLVVFSVMCLSS